MRPHPTMPAEPTPGLEPASDRNCPPGSPTSHRRVCDVIGEPQAWPNHLAGAESSPKDFRGATIADVIVVGSEIAVCTKGGACGRTFSVFTIEDDGLRERVRQALRYGMSVYAAAYEEI